MNLALRYRPKTFDDIVGQKHIKPVLRAMISQRRLPPALLFSGSRGTGKTTTARLMAAALNCEAEQKPCAECLPCQSVQNSSSMDVLEIDAASNGLVADIRKIKDMVLYQHGGEWRIVLLDEAHSMSKEAFNALLKVLEEPPPKTLFVLITTEPSKIIDTVVSRSMSFEFRRLSVEEIVSRLMWIAEREQLDVQPSLLNEIAVRAKGGMRDAVMVLEQLRYAGVVDVQGFRELMGITSVAESIFRSAVDADYAAGTKLLDEHFYRVGDAVGIVDDLTLLVRDLLVIRSGGDPLVASEIELEDRRHLSSLVPMEKLIAVVRLLWDLKARMRYSDVDQRASMEMCFVLMADALHKVVDVSSPSTTNGNGNGSHKLSMDEFKKLAMNVGR